MCESSAQTEIHTIMSEATCPLLRLPPDVLLHIFAFSRPFEILRLRQTCTLLEDLSHERILWVYFLRLFLRQSRFPSASFSIDSMTSAELEAAVTVPLRFIRNFAHDEPNSRAQASCIKGTYKVHSIDLVAGDRYLASLSGSRIVLWDLGIVGNRDSKTSPRMVAQIQCDIPKRQKPWLQTETLGEDIFVRVTSSRWQGTWTIIYKINPNQTLPKFQRFATLKTRMFSHTVYNFEPAKMVVLFSGSQSGNFETQDIWIWDLKTDTLINWFGEPGTIDSIYCTADRMIILGMPPDSEKIAFEGQVFALPQPPSTLSETSPPPEVHTVPKPLLHKIDLRKDLSNVDNLIQFRTAESWEAAIGTSFSFDIIAYFEGYEDASQCCILRKTLRPCEDDPSTLDLVTEHQAVYEGEMFIPPRAEFTACDLFHDDQRMMYWLETAADGSGDSTISTRIICHLSSLVGDDTHEMCKTLYAHSWVGDGFVHAFSVRTGRLCFVSGSNSTNITFYNYGV
ncbi:hypothetical protein DL96DRAFT_1099030 [Flagelloscypha sp. PMI_526]|nr:hypothetical protein DL96DRAFT_1099030 [Flagelloscypha sp. PMI_526]